MPNTCETPYCRNDPKGRKHCSTCRYRKWRKENPFKYHYNNLRNRARQRGKVFNLALEQFKLIWLCEPEKWEEKLAESECQWQMDRIQESGHYEFNNIQILSKSRNIHKYLDHKRQFHMKVDWSVNKESVIEKAPF